MNSFNAMMMYNLSNFNNRSWVNNGTDHRTSLHEGGLFSGHSPIGTTLQLFLVQALLIIGISRLLHLGLNKLRQPLVIAEIVGGICLGPSMLGLIPGFSNTLFPPKSLPFLGLVANIGLVLYLFLVGLELNPKAFFRNLKHSVVIGIAGIVLPFGTGAAISIGIYKSLLVPSFSETYNVAFVSFLLFMGGAFSITAFPILGRILTSFNMTNTTVGVVTLTASALTDSGVWTLLALIVAIINATSMLGALYMLLVLVGYALLILIGLRWLLAKIYLKMLHKRNNQLNKFVVSVIFMLVFFSSWFTDMLGLNAIFGSFLIGLAIPRHENFHIRITEKLEDVVTIFLLPLFFANSGLKTKLNLLNDGWVWLWLIIVVLLACASKMVGCGLAAKILGMPWRDSIAVGILMSTRALIELIVLNIGLELRVINDRIFVLMVMMALVTTFITCPLIARFYPPIYYKRTDKLDKQGSPLELGMDNQFNSIRVCIYAECVDSVSRLCKFVKLMRSDANNVELNVIRTVESNETMASVIGAANATEIDPVLKTAEVLGDFIGVPTTCFLETSEYEKIGEVLHDLARMEKYNFLLIRWSQCGFINLTLINEIFIAAPITTAILIEPTALGKSVFDQTDRLEILVPFVGGLNDRKAVSLAVSLSSPNGVRVRILRFLKSQIRPSKSLPKIVEKAFSNSINTENATPEDLEDDQLIKKVKLESNPKMEVLVISTEESANIEQAIGQEYMGSCYNLIIMGKPMIFYEKENSFTPDNNYRSKVLSRKHSETIKARLLHQTSVHSHNSAFWESPDYIFGKTASRLMGTVTCPILVIREPFVNKPDLL